MSSKLEIAIAAGNVKDIQTAIKAYITADPLDKSGEVENGISSAESRGLKIWQDHDKKPFIEDKSQWNKDYFRQLQTQMMMNFSKERITHMLKVAKVAYKDELSLPVQPKISVSTQLPTTSQPQVQRPTDGKKLIPIIVGGIVILVAVGAIIRAMNMK
jgi:hypothetical protein